MGCDMMTSRVRVSFGDWCAESALLAPHLTRSILRRLDCKRQILTFIAVPWLIAIGAMSTSLAQTPAKPPQAAQAQDGSDFVYSPWTKICDKFQGTKDVCVTARDSRTTSGQTVTAVALVEPVGEPKKSLRVTIPSPVQLLYGASISIDTNQAIVSPFFFCMPTGCLVEYDMPPDLIAKMKSGQMLRVQAINLGGEQVSYSIPLTDFKKANEGPPADMKAMQEQQTKLREELQKKADEERKRLGVPQ